MVLGCMPRISADKWVLAPPSIMRSAPLIMQSASWRHWYSLLMDARGLSALWVTMLLQAACQQQDLGASQKLSRNGWTSCTCVCTCYTCAHSRLLWQRGWLSNGVPQVTVVSNSSDNPLDMFHPFRKQIVNLRAPKLFHVPVPKLMGMCACVLVTRPVCAADLTISRGEAVVTDNQALLCMKSIRDPCHRRGWCVQHASRLGNHRGREEEHTWLLQVLPSEQVVFFSCASGGCYAAQKCAKDQGSRNTSVNTCLLMQIWLNPSCVFGCRTNFAIQHKEQTQ